MAVRSLPWAVALVLFATMLLPGNALAVRTPTAKLGAESASGVISVRWSVPVRVVHPRSVVFLSGTGRRLRWRALSGRLSRAHAFSVAGRAQLERVRVGRHAARTRSGRWARAMVLMVRRAPVVAPAPADAGSVAAPVVAAPVVAAPVLGPPAPDPAPAPQPDPAPAPQPDPAPRLPLVTPVSGSAFVDSVGVNVHMSYFSTAYNNWQQVRDRLVQLGVRHVRDGACVGCTAQRQRLLALASAGIGVDFIMRQPGSPDSVASLVDMLAGPMRPAVDAIEGPNEYDTSGGSGWAASLRDYQTQIYALTRGNPALAGVPVVGPSLVNSRSYSLLGSLGDALDVGNVHPYAGGGLPTVNLASNLSLETVTAGSKPVMATEAGYHNALAATSGQPPVSEDAAAAYVPRLFLDMFRAGIARTYLYELVDQHADAGLTTPEDNFGLLRSDFSEKPAFQSLAALLHLTDGDGSRFALNPLQLEVVGAPADMRQLLLQTGPHSYALVLWRDVSVWNATQRSALTPAPAGVGVKLGSEVSGVTLQDLDQAGSSSTVQGPAPSLAVPVGGTPVVLTISA
jgi:hypothetical protein